MSSDNFVLFLQILFIGLWFVALIIPYWILKHWSEEKKKLTAIRNNMISITPITYDMTRRNFREDIQQKLCRDAFCDWFN